MSQDPSVPKNSGLMGLGLGLGPGNNILGPMGSDLGPEPTFWVR